MERRDFVGALLALFCGVALPRERENIDVFADYRPAIDRLSRDLASVQSMTMMELETALDRIIRKELAATQRLVAGIRQPRVDG